MIDRSFCFAFVLAAVALSSSSFAVEKDRDGGEKKTWTAGKRSAHETVWKTVSAVTNSAIGKVVRKTNSYVELATGLNILDGQGRFKAAEPEFKVTPHGAEAKGTAHKVRLPNNINTAGGVRVTLATTAAIPNEVVLQSHPLGLGYFDPTDGRSVLLASIQDSIGQVRSATEIIYPKAFDNIDAAILYRNSFAGLEQDLVLYEQPPAPETFGLSPASRLELFTEFMPNSAVPRKTERLIREEKDQAKRAQMREPDFADTHLDYGTMSMGIGRAFALEPGRNREKPEATAPGVLVGKRLEVIEGRTVLIEAVEHQSIKAILTNLPPARELSVTNASLRGNLKTAGYAARSLPNRRPTSSGTNSEVLMAALPSSALADQQPAFIVDFQLFQNQGVTGYTFPWGFDLQNRRLPGM